MRLIQLPKLYVEGSIPFTRSILSGTQAEAKAHRRHTGLMDCRPLPDTKLLDAIAAADELGLRSMEVRALMEAGELPIVAVAGRDYVALGELRRWVSERMRASRACEIQGRPADRGMPAASAEAASLRRVFSNARDRAKRKDEPFQLSYADFRIIVSRADGRCELSGVPFDWSPGTTSRRPFAASLDRISCGRPYAFDNCRLVAVALNYALNEWGEEVFARLAAGYLAKRPSA